MTASWLSLWPGTSPSQVELLGLGQIFSMCTCRTIYHRVVQAPETKLLLSLTPSQDSGHGRVGFPPEFRPSGTEPSIRPLEVRSAGGRAPIVAGPPPRHRRFRNKHSHKEKRQFSRYPPELGTCPGTITCWNTKGQQVGHAIFHRCCETQWTDQVTMTRRASVTHGRVGKSSSPRTPNNGRAVTSAMLFSNPQKLQWPIT